MKKKLLFSLLLTSVHASCVMAMDNPVPEKLINAMRLAATGPIDPHGILHWMKEGTIPVFEISSEDNAKIKSKFASDFDHAVGDLNQCAKEQNYATLETWISWVEEYPLDQQSYDWYVPRDAKERKSRVKYALEDQLKK